MIPIPLDSNLVIPTPIPGLEKSSDSIDSDSESTSLLGGILGRGVHGSFSPVEPKK